jgi:hypothetical protein
VANRPDEYTLTKLASLARQHTEKGIEILGGLATAHPDPNIKLRALEMLFDRGWGKVGQEVTVGPAEGKPAFEIILRHITEGVKAPQK